MAQRRSDSKIMGRPDVIEDYLANKGRFHVNIKQTKPTKNSLRDPVYILLRTSNRPNYFRRCMESIKAQTYKNIVVIVHSDDPRDDYLDGDIIIRGPVYPPHVGTGPYNLYNNRLLAAIPNGPGWYHFIDDDDEYTAPNVIQTLVSSSRTDCVNVGRVRRWKDTIWPKNWGIQRSYQTECFFLHASHKNMAKWWSNKGGDHYYSRQLTERLKIHWIDGLIICQAQEGKNHGKRYDKHKLAPVREIAYADTDSVPVLMCNKRPKSGHEGIIEMMPYADALKMEKAGAGIITYAKLTIEDRRHEKKDSKEVKQEDSQKVNEEVGTEDTEDGRGNGAEDHSNEAHIA